WANGQKEKRDCLKSYLLSDSLFFVYCGIRTRFFLYFFFLPF
ncbi:MAG: hypothetical protein AVDCRST_MAG96-2396, partial [uncultured Segetibacter sp.]